MLPNFWKIKNDAPKLKAAWKIIYPTYFSPAPAWTINNERSLNEDNVEDCESHLRKDMLFYKFTFH